MHDIPDTDDEDSKAEVFWPDSYKEVIRREQHKVVLAAFGRGNGFKGIYETSFADKYSSFEEFAETIATKVVIGAEVGSDDAFDEIYSSFAQAHPLPRPRRYASYLWPGALPPKAQEELKEAIAQEYRRQHSYEHAYEDHYQGQFASLDDFIRQVAELVTLGAINGADNTLSEIYRSFVTGCPLPPARRHPRRLKGW